MFNVTYMWAMCIAVAQGQQLFSNESLLFTKKIMQVTSTATWPSYLNDN